MNGKGKWTKAKTFDTWVFSLLDYLYCNNVDRDSPYAFVVAGFFLEDIPRDIHNQWRLDRKRKSTKLQEFLQELRDMIVPSTYKLSEWDEFQRVKQTMDGRSRPIGKVAAELKGFQSRLAVVTEKQLFYRLREAMDPRLRELVGPHINEDMKWKDIIPVCERFDSNLQHGKSYNRDRNENYQGRNKNQGRGRYRQRPQQNFRPPQNSYRPGFTNRTTNTTRNFQPRNQRKFPQLSQQDKDRLRTQGKCFICKKTGHMANECPEKRRSYNKPSINSAATTLTPTDQETIPTEITTAASAINTLHKVPMTTFTPKANYAQKAKIIPRIKANIERDHVLVETRINGHLAKTLVDQQTVGGDLISNKFCTTYKIPTIPLKENITINHTTKGSKGSCNSYAQVTLDYGNYSETRNFYVCALHAWDVIPGEPALSAVHATISLPKKIVSIQPPRITRFILKPWKFKYKDESTTTIPKPVPVPTIQQLNQPQINSMATTLEPK